jgi:predicted transcriptional regulator
MRGNRILSILLLGMIILSLSFSTTENSASDTVVVEIYILLTDAPNGTVLDNSFISPMESLLVYASAYREDDNSYIGLLEVNWTLSEPSAGSLSNTTGKSTTFTAGMVGITTKLNATNDNHMISYEITIDIFPPQPDSVQIRSEPNGGGVDLSDPHYYPYYEVGEIVILWGALYNESGGYMGDVDPGSMWGSNDSINASVTTPGINTTLTCGSNPTTVAIFLNDPLSGQFIHTNITILALAPQVDMITIQTAPRNESGWFGSGIYKTDDEAVMYAAGFNGTYGRYLGEVDVDWTCNDTIVGNVTTPGNSTIFTAEGEGFCFVQADYGGIINFTGILTVVGVQEIRIRSEPNGGGIEIGDESFFIGEGTTFWAAGYADPFGYLSDVSVTWASSDTNYGIITSQGASADFEAIGEGTCFVWAEYKPGISDSTGTISVQAYTIDSINILDFPGGLGFPVGDRSYDIGINTRFYAAGFNSTAGYIDDVNVVWSVDDPEVGSVTSPGMDTTFETLESGTCIITADYGGGITASTGTISVSMIDEIRIQKGQEEGAPPVSDQEYNMGNEDAFWAVGYNNTNGYVGAVNVTWISSDQNVGSVDPTGTSTSFNAIAVGVCFVTADFGGGIINTTGTLTVIPFDVDFIRILELPGGLGSPVGRKSYDIGETDIFYAAGYNFTGGYIGDIAVTWSSDNQDVAIVVTTGSQTSFSTLGSGQCYIKADYGNGIEATTGLISVALVDEIRILESSGEGSTPVDDRNYVVGESDTLWAVGYNDTYGYIGPLDVAWESSNSFVGSVSQFGSSSEFTSKWIGTCFVQATHSSRIIGVTGTLTIVLPSTITVDDDGDVHFNSIKEALEYAKPGDTIIVYQGTYDGPLEIDISLTLMGEDNGNTIIDGGNSEDVVRITSDDVTISGFTIQGGDRGIYCDGSDSIVIEDNIITNISEYFIFSDSCKSLTISNNTSTGGEIYISDSTVTELSVEQTTLTNHDSTIDNLDMDVTSEVVIQLLLSIMVIDDQNQPIEDAVVYLFDAQDNLISIFITDSNGLVRSIPLTASIENLTSTQSHLPYTIVVEKNSYESATHIMNMNQDNTLGVSLKDETMVVKTAGPGFPWAIVLVVGFIGTLAILATSSILMEAVLFGLISLFLPLFTRLKRSDILSQPIRERIYGYILGNPGANYGAIKQDLSIANGQLVYHLRQLADAHMIYSRKDGIKKRFFPVEHPKPKGPIYYLNETQKRILKAIRKVAGQTQQDIAKTAGISRQMAYYHLTKLEQKGIIYKETHGVERRYFPIENPQMELNI